MNAFYEHDQDDIRFGYRCFDRILLNCLIQAFQRPGGWSAFPHLLQSVPRQPRSVA